MITNETQLLKRSLDSFFKESSEVGSRPNNTGCTSCSDWLVHPDVSHHGFKSEHTVCKARNYLKLTCSLSNYNEMKGPTHSIPGGPVRALMGNKKKKRRGGQLTHTIVSARLGRGINISKFKGEFRLNKRGQNER